MHQIIQISDESMVEEPRCPLLTMYSNISTQNSKGQDYGVLTQLSKVYFLSCLQEKVGKPIVEHPNAKYDLFTIAKKFQKQSLDILSEEEDELCMNFRNVYKRGMTIDWIAAEILRYSQREYNRLRDEAAIRQEARGDLYLHCLFHLEKDALFDACVGQSPVKHSRLYLRKPKICQQCGKGDFEYSKKHQQFVCSAECEKGKPRRFGDITFIPNFSYAQEFIGGKLLKPEEAQYWKNMKKIPLRKSNHNNLKQIIGQRYLYSDLIVWRGLLAEIPIETPNLTIICASEAGAIHHAIRNQARAELQIRRIENKGFGVLATADIDERTVVATYVGEMFLSRQYRFWIHNDSMVRLGWIGNSELFLAPVQFANVGRYFNSPSQGQHPNMKAQWVLVDGARDINNQLRPRSLFLVLSTIRKVKAGEQLVWDYGNQYNTAYASVYEGKGME